MAGVHRQRWQLLRHVDAAVDKPLTVLALVWLVLLVVELAGTLPPALRQVGVAIWALFAFDFLLELVIAPARLAYLRRNWLTAVALVLPALRVLRIARVARVLRAGTAARPLSLVRVLARVNRTMRALGRFFGRRGFGYVMATTIAVTFAGAAGMYAFESRTALASAGFPSAGGFRDFGDALWWTAMMMTTMGSQYWPQTLEGRLLCWLLAVYAFAMFGYITATIASLFISVDRGATSRTR